MSIGAMYNFWMKGLVGPPANTGDGAEVIQRMGRQGDSIESNLHDPLYESTRRNQRFTMQCSATTTGIAAGNIYAAAAAASTQFALWNPNNSQVDVVLSKFFLGVISGTVPAGALYHDIATVVPTIASTFSAGSISNGYVNGPVGNVAKGVAHAAGTTLTGGGALSHLRPCPFFFSAGSYAQLGGQVFEEDINGDIILTPGTMWVPTWSGAGTSVLNSYGVTWEEVPR